MNLLTTKQKICTGVMTHLYKKLTRSIKVFLMFLLFTGGFIASTKAQTCTAMSTKSPSCPNEVIVYNATLTNTGGSQNVPLTWNITIGTGAFFTTGTISNGGLTTMTTGQPGSGNTVSVNVGPTASLVTVVLSPGSGGGSCSASSDVSKLSVTASAPAIPCNGGTTTITAVVLGGQLN